MSVEERILSELGEYVGIDYIKSILVKSNTEVLDHIAKLLSDDFQRLLKETKYYVEFDVVDSAKFGILIMERRLNMMFFLANEVRNRM